MLTFEWDRHNRLHIARHAVASEEVEQVLANDPISLEQAVLNDEWRQIYLGETKTGRILVVVTTQREEIVRVVTAWPAKERLRPR